MTLPILTLDFETYFESRGYTLKKYTTIEYITDDLFKVHGVGVLWDGQQIWFTDMDAFRHFLADVGENVTLLCHNTMFDGFILHHHFNYHPQHYADTMLMSRGIFIGQKAGLADLSKRLWPQDESMRKGEELINTIDKRELTPDEAEELGGYCLQDIRLTRAAYDIMEQNFPDDELRIIDLTLQFFCQPKLEINKGLVQRTIDQTNAQRDKAIADSGLPETKLASNQQFARWIESQSMTVPTKISLTTGEETDALGKNDLEFQKLRKAHPQWEHVWKARLAAKSVGEITRAKRFMETANMCGGMMPVPLSYYGAHTGRYSGLFSLNLQNLGRDSPLRRALRAPNGQNVYVADSAQIEARMNNWNAGQREMVEAFARNEDVYSKFASEHVYHKPVNKKDNPTERFVAKTAVLGLGYGMGAHKFQTTLATGAQGPEVLLDDHEAKFIVQAYRRAHYMITRYWQQCETKLLQMLNSDCDEPWGVLHLMHKMIVLPNGMALQYPGLQADQDPRTEQIQFRFYNGRYWKDTYGAQICENLTQALSRIVLFEQMLKANDYVQRYDPNGRVVLNVHDEIVAVASDFGSYPTGETYENDDGEIKDVWANTSEADEFYQGFEDILREQPSWAPDLPLDGEGGYDRCYAK